MNVMYLSMELVYVSTTWMSLRPMKTVALALVAANQVAETYEYFFTINVSCSFSVYAKKDVRFDFRFVV